MSNMLVVGSYALLMMLLIKFHDRLRRVEGDLLLARVDIGRLERQGAARPAAPDPTPPPAPPVATKPVDAAPPPRPARRPTPTPPPPPAPPAPPVTGAEKRKPGGWERVWNANVPAKLGALITLLGFSFLLKLAIDQGWFQFPIWARHLAVGVAGLAFVGTGWWLRDSRPHLARALLGSGFATIQLTVYSAVLVFGVLAPGPGFSLVVVGSIATGVLAGVLHSRAFAILAIVGGLAAPMLLPDAWQWVTAVLGYYAILSGPILWLAWRKRWPELNLLSFAGVFGASFIWTFLASWDNTLSAAETEPMVWLLFAEFAAVLVVTHIRRGDTNLRFLERILLYATPSATLSLLALVLRDSVDLAWRSLALGVVYAMLATVLWRGRLAGPELRRHFVAVGCGFTTLAVPLGFDGYTVAAIWALGGVLQVVTGALRKSRGYTAAGIVLQAAAGFAWWISNPPVADAGAFSNGAFVTAAWIGLAGLVSAWVLDRRVRRDWATATAWAPFLWGAGWWLGAGIREIDRVLEFASMPSAILLFAFGSLLAAGCLELRERWSKLDIVAPAAGLGLVAMLIMTAAAVDHPSAEVGWLAWPFAIAAFLWFVHRNETGRLHGVPFGYGLTHALFVIWTCWELHHQVSRFSEGIWPFVAIGLFLVLSSLFRLTPALSPRWPVGPTRDAHFRWIPAVTSLVALGAVGLLQLSPGDPVYFPFVPLLNPVDVVSGLFLLLLYRSTRDEDPELGPTLVTLLGWGFSTLTLARTVHHWAGVRFDPASLYESMTMQTSLTVYWSLLGVVGMVLGARRGGRTLWKVAAGLMAFVLLKLFLVDLAGVNTLARIVSFLGVGGLLLLLGYLAPQPPRISAAAR